MSKIARPDDHERVVFGHDEETGLEAIIAIHSTALGPALGGTRFHPYATEDDALKDALRLSRGMSYKAACAGLDLGGGKAVIIGDPEADKNDALLRVFGRLVSSLNGQYITACDVGTYPRDMEMIARETRWVTGRAIEHGGSGDSGVLTAYGVYVGMKAAAHYRWGAVSLARKHVAIQGLGKVGRRVAARLLDDGARLTVTDTSEDAVADFDGLPGVDVVPPQDIIDVDADVFSPNALGAVLNEDSIERLQAEIVCGGANNQLAADEDDLRLHERGVLYAPDYVVNAGGLIAVSDELNSSSPSRKRCRRKAARIGDTLLEVLTEASATGTSSGTAARQIAKRRIWQARSGPRCIHPPSRRADHVIARQIRNGA